jgi:hypothetical protein
MPASLIYLVVLIVQATVGGQFDRISSSIYLIAAMYGVQGVVYIIRRKYVPVA